MQVRDEEFWAYVTAYCDAYDKAATFAQNIGLSEADTVQFAHDEALRITHQQEAKRPDEPTR